MSVEVTTTIDLTGDPRVQDCPTALLVGTVPTVVEACPGNGTRYVLVLMPIPSMAAKHVLLGIPPTSGECVLVSLWPGGIHSACAVLRRDAGYLAVSYIQQKFQLGFADARAVAKILAPLLGRTEPP